MLRSNVVRSSNTEPESVVISVRVVATEQTAHGGTGGSRGRRM